MLGTHAACTGGMLVSDNNKLWERLHAQCWLEYSRQPGSALLRKGSGASLQGQVVSRVGYAHVYFLNLSLPPGTRRRTGGCIRDVIHLIKLIRDDRNIIGCLFRHQHIFCLIQDISEMNLRSQSCICCSKEHCLTAWALHKRSSEQCVIHWLDNRVLPP